MRPRVRRAAIEGLDEVLSQGAYARVVLDKARERLPADELAQVSDLLLGALRWLSRLDRTIDTLCQRPPARWVRNALRLALYQLEHSDRLPAHAVVSETVELARRVKGARVGGFVNGVLRGFLRQRTSEDLLRGPDAEATALAAPPWLYDRLASASSPERARAVLQGLLTPATLDLRVHPRRAEQEAVRARLAGRARAVTPIPDHPGGLEISGPSGLFQDPGWEDGEWIVQDRNSARVGALIAPLLTGRVLDVCSGAGIKLLEWTAAPRVTAVVAVDRSSTRLARGQALLTRWWAGPAPTPVQDVAADASRPLPVDGLFDAVIVDAPCSGTGTIRRRPEIKWRLTADAVDDLVTLQRAILTQAARQVAPGGLLAYIVCSLLPEEGARLIAELLDRDRAFRPASDVAPQPGAASGPGCATLFDPDAPGDGFQLAVLRRVE
jgi:16S rRNA (cytosine967-C5)-methyltransferase